MFLTISFYEYYKDSLSDLDLTLAVGGGGSFTIKVVKKSKNNYTVTVSLKNEVFNFETWEKTIGKITIGKGGVEAHSNNVLIVLINNFGAFTQNKKAFIPFTWKFSVTFEYKI